MQVKSIAECSGEHSAILSAFIKLLLLIKIFVWSILELPLKTGFTVYLLYQYLYGIIHRNEKGYNMEMVYLSL